MAKWRRKWPSEKNYRRRLCWVIALVYINGYSRSVRWLALISVTRGNLPDHGFSVRKRNAVISFPSQRIHLRLFEYRGKHSRPITELASPTNTLQVSSISLGARVISSDERCVIYPPYKSCPRYGPRESWEEYHGWRRFEFRRGGARGSVATFSTSHPTMHRITFDRPAEDASRDCGGWKLTARHRNPLWDVTEGCRGFVSILTFERANNGWIEKCRPISKKFVHCFQRSTALSLDIDLPFSLFFRTCTCTYIFEYIQLYSYRIMVRSDTNES